MTPDGLVIPVYGHVEASGTAIEPVVFTSTEDSGPGEWGGLALAGSAAHLNHKGRGARPALTTSPAQSPIAINYPVVGRAQL